MNKEKLEKEAEEYTNKLLEDWELYDPEALQEAYIAGAESREKQIAELVTTIEKSKEWGVSPFNYLIIKNLDDRVTKAKEIIKELTSCIRHLNEPDVEMKLIDVDVFLKPAEDFIKEVD